MKFNTVLFVNATIGFSENLFLVDIYIYCRFDNAMDFILSSTLLGTPTGITVHL